MSASSLPKSRSSEILRSRYRDLLKGTAPSKIASGLCNNDLLSKEELQTILSFEVDAKRHHELLDILSHKGIPMLTKYSAAIKSIKKQPNFTNSEGSLGEAPSCSSQGPLVHTPVILHDSHKMDEECQGFPITNHLPVGNLQDMNSARGKSPIKVQTGDASIQTAKQGSPAGDSCVHNGYDLVAIRGNASSDCSIEHSTIKELQSCEQLFLTKMEAFTVLLFTFFSQLRVSIDQQLSLVRGEATSKDKQSSSSHHDQQAKNHLSWITLDVDWQSIREYFPAEFLKGVNPSVEHLVPLRLSVLLDAFQQLCQRYKQLLQDNESMQSKLKCLPEVIQQKSILEAKLKERVIATGPYSPSTSSKGAESQHDVRHKLKRLESLERAYANTEERCKQLVEVTQQWSAECADKDKLIAVQSTQVDQLTAELDKIQKRLSKYKKHWMATKDAPPQRAPDAQFEELRLELACRRELHDQVVAERDEAQKTIVQLNAEIDELKDLIEELRDRLSNFKVQAQAKEPTIREMSHVMEENRKLREELEQVRKTFAEQSDKLLAYETYVSDLTSGGERQHLQPAPPPTATNTTSATRPPPVMPSSSNRSTTTTTGTTSAFPQPKPKRAPSSQQAMVTGGFGIPSHIKREVQNRNPQLKLPKQQPPHATNGDDIISRGAPPLLDTPTHRQHSSGHNSHTSNGVSDDDSSSVTTMTSSSSNEDSLSQRSVNGRGCHAYRPGSAPGRRNDHTYQSTSTQLPPQQYNDTYSSYSAPATPLKTSTSQSRLPPTASPPRAPPQWTTKYPPGVQIPPSLQNGASSTYSTHGVGDYTHRVHYPNNSGIIVKPLTDDERTLHHGNSCTNGDNSAPRVHEDPIALLPADSTLYDFTLNEKQCPVCQHVFVTLTEKEFQSHVALCFK